MACAWPLLISLSQGTEKPERLQVSTGDTGWGGVGGAMRMPESLHEAQRIPTGLSMAALAEQPRGPAG